MTVRAVVFDIGGVLVDWRPELAWAEELGSEEAAHDFMARTDFKALNLRADGGERFADLAREVEDPEDAARIATYPARFTRTLNGAIEATWELLDALHARGIKTHAITNWSAETWPEGLKRHPRLGEVFETLIVSGREGMLKPTPQIFELFCSRAGVAPQDCLFTDDGAHNVAGAQAVGMDGIHFTGPGALHSGLKARGLI